MTGIRPLALLALLFVAPLLAQETPATPQADENKTPIANEALRTDLLKRVEKDQEARMAMLAWMRKRNFSDPTAIDPENNEILKKVQQIDRENTERLRKIVDESGWPGAGQVGVDGAHAAWLLLQHADQNPDFQKRCLAIMKQAAPGEVSPTDIAYLSDRVTIKETGKQLYGTQLEKVDGKWAPKQLIEPDRVDKLRAEAGLPPMSEYLAFAKQMFDGDSPSDQEIKKIEPIVRTADLNIGEQCDITMANGETIQVKLLDLQEKRDSIRSAVRQATVTVSINGKQATIASATYHLPTTIGNVQVDCPITKGHVQPNANPWALDKDARLRFWPNKSPWIKPETFVYPVNQRWFASETLMSNEIGDDERHDDTSIYYHWGLDFGGAEKLVDVSAATDGVVVSSGDETIQGEEIPSIVHPRYDVIYLRDGRGWYYRYSHLDSIGSHIKPGAVVRMGDKIGVLGKKGASGGWSHLHFDIGFLQPSGRYGISDGYAFVWEAYKRQNDWPIQAVARPHQLVWTGASTTLDGSRSVKPTGSGNLEFEWQLSDGTTADTPTVTHSFDKPGSYCEILKVTDQSGNTDYDFALVQVLDPKHPDQQPPTVHATYWPTAGIQAGDAITFKVRSFRIDPEDGRETWDFGDGSPTVNVKSPGNSDPLAENGYAITTHQFAKPGHYVVSVSRTNRRGHTGTARLQIRVK